MAVSGSASGSRVSGGEGSGKGLREGLGGWHGLMLIRDRGSGESWRLGKELGVGLSVGSSRVVGNRQGRSMCSIGGRGWSKRRAKGSVLSSKGRSKSKSLGVSMSKISRVRGCTSKIKDWIRSKSRIRCTGRSKSKDMI